MKTWIVSFRNALRGLVQLFRTERNAQIELVIAIVVVALGFLFNFNTQEWFILLLCIFLVIAFEALNTALEKALDRLHPDRHPLIGQAKDLAAGAVLLVSIFAAIVGILLFYPHVVKWLEQL